MNHDWIQEAAREILKPVADYAHGYRLVNMSHESPKESQEMAAIHNNAIDMVVMQFQDPNDTVDLEREIAVIISRHLSGTEQSEIILRDLAESYPISYDDFAVVNGYRCQLCGVGAGEPENLKHKESCVWIRARALSPTSDANKESL